jgi:hypothetical protein
MQIDFAPRLRYTIITIHQFISGGHFMVLYPGGKQNVLPPQEISAHQVDNPPRVGSYLVTIRTIRRIANHV